jgi:sugar phosphate isomerase/epimerase
MRCAGNIHLAYCTNIHRGENWETTFRSLQTHTLAVRRRVCPLDQAYAIGLRLSEHAARELSEPRRLQAFKRWLREHNCYVFTINGFPYADFHAVRVKEQVYAPDWTTPQRLAYTKLLFTLLAELVPAGVSASVSTVPGSFKAFIREPAQVDQMLDHLLDCADFLAELSERHGTTFHLGLEPEPFGYLENTAEVVAFFQRLKARAKHPERVTQHIGVNYDCCHLAIQYENPIESLAQLAAHGIRLSKLHLSAALKIVPTPKTRAQLRQYLDPVYLHQVVALKAGGDTTDRVVDLDQALKWDDAVVAAHQEWRVHFHVPLHAAPGFGMATTVDHLIGTFDYLAQHPNCCEHLEIETYTWEVLPPQLKAASVVDQIVAEYTWTKAALAERELSRHRAARDSS